jgi:integrase/recombinase XerD
VWKNRILWDFQMKQARVLTDQEFKRLLAVIKAHKHARRNRLAVMLSHLAGLRVGEIAHLTVGDVYDADGKVREQILLKREYTRGNQARTVYVGQRLAAELVRFRPPEPVRFPDQPLIRSQKGGGFSANTLCQLFGELFQKAGIDGASSHSGRRSFITKMAHAGVSPKVIMTLAGHKHLGTTQRYIDVNDDMMRAAVDLV